MIKLLLIQCNLDSVYLSFRGNIWDNFKKFYGCDNNILYKQ